MINQPGTLRHRARPFARLHAPARALALLVAAFSMAIPLASAAELAIPTGHPRLWWNAARLTRARQWYAANPFTPSSGAAFGNALRYVLTGEQAYARNAIAALMSFTISDAELKGVASDNYRWNDWVPVVFDWTYDAMTAQERQDFIARYNRYVDIMRQKSWGGTWQPSGNYYWGYWRNEFNWAVASFYHNPDAQKFLDYALTTRWTQSFVPWAAGPGRGGVPHEGSQYGRYMLGYPVIPLVSAELMGRSLFSETAFHRDAILYLIYTTVQSPSGYQVFPFNDDEAWLNGWSAQSADYGNFMLAASAQWKGQPIGQYARQWLNVVKPNFSAYAQAVDEGGAARPFTTLPLDYYAPGLPDLFLRNSWNADATVVNVQLGVPNGAGHQHFDAGTFQISRSGRWLSRETVGYSDWITGYNGASVDVTRTIAHNGIVFNGLGMANAYVDGPPEVRRLESRDDYAYAVVDLTKAYRAHASSQPARDDNPYVGHIEREFLFVRPLETLVIFDRLSSTSEQGAAENVTKTFVTHFETAPVISGNTVVGVNGTQALRVTTLVPQSAAPRVVFESGYAGGQQRLEVDTKGARDSYMLHVLQAKEASGPNVLIRLSEDANTYTVTLEHPTNGRAVIVFQKGMSSAGGSFGYSPTGLPSRLTPILDRVQGISTTSSGPLWEGAPAPATSDTTPPTVTVTAPAAGASISGSVAIAAAASDDQAVAAVQFQVDGTPLGAPDTGAPYLITWDTTSSANGAHTVTATATDAAGNQRTASAVAVTVANAAATSSPPPSAEPVTRVVEAEQGRILSVFQLGSDGQASGGAYLAVPTLSPATSGQIEVQVPVTLPADGTYYLWARLFGPSEDEDAIYIGFDGSFDRVFPSQHGTYEWVRVERVDRSGNVAHFLPAGLHQLTIGHAEPHVRVDALAVTTDPAFVPPAPMASTAALTPAPQPVLTPVPPATILPAQAPAPQATTPPVTSPPTPAPAPPVVVPPAPAVTTPPVQAPASPPAIILPSVSIPTMLTLPAAEAATPPPAQAVTTPAATIPAAAILPAVPDPAPQLPASPAQTPAPVAATDAATPPAVPAITLSPASLPVTPIIPAAEAATLPPTPAATIPAAAILPAVPDPAPQLPASPAQTPAPVAAPTTPPPAPSAPALSVASTATPLPESLAAGLVAHWSLDEGTGTTVAEGTGQQPSGVLRNGPRWVPGRLGAALSFDGVDDYVDAGPLPPVTAAFTIAGWLYRSADPARAERAMWVSQGIDGQDGWAVLVQNPARADGRILHSFLKGGVALVTSGVPSRKDAWEHVAWVVDAQGRPALYLNGLRVSTGTHTIPIRPPAPGTTTLLGANQTYPATPTGFFPGTLDDLRLYRRVLSDAEIANLAQQTSADLAASSLPSVLEAAPTPAPVAAPTTPPPAPSAPALSVASTATPLPESLAAGLVAHWSLDEGTGTTVAEGTGQQPSGVLRNGPRWVPGRLGAALSFDGVDDYVDAGPLPPVTAAFTIAGWLYRSADPARAERAMWVSQGIDGQDGWAVLVQNPARADGRILHSFLKGGVALVTSGVPSRKDAWEHVAWVVDAQGRPALYLNGLRVSTGTHTIPIRPPAPGTTTLLGANQTYPATPTGFFPGTLDDLRLYRRVLSDAEIANLAAQ